MLAEQLKIKFHYDYSVFSGSLPDWTDSVGIDKLPLMKSIKAILPIVGLVIFVAVFSIWFPNVIIALPKLFMPKVFGL